MRRRRGVGGSPRCEASLPLGGDCWRRSEDREDPDPPAPVSNGNPSGKRSVLRSPPHMPPIHGHRYGPTWAAARRSPGAEPNFHYGPANWDPSTRRRALLLRFLLASPTVPVHPAGAEPIDDPMQRPGVVFASSWDRAVSAAGCLIHISRIGIRSTSQFIPTISCSPSTARS